MNKYLRTPLREGIGDGSDGGGGAPTDTPPEIDFSSEDTFARFRETLPDDLKGHKLFQETKSFESLAQQTINAQSALGKKRLEAPGEDWDDTRWSEFHSQFVPEDYELPEKLELRLSEDGDIQNYELKKETAAELKSVAKELGMSSAQAKKLTEVWAKRELASSQELDGQIQKAVSDQISELRSEWGDQFEVNHRSANEAYDVLVKEVPELEALMQWSPVVANHPATMKLFHRLAPLVKDLGVAGGSGRMGSGFEGETVAQIDAELQDLMTTHEQLINSDPGTLSFADQEKRQKVLERRSELYRKKYSD